MSFLYSRPVIPPRCEILVVEDDSNDLILIKRGFQKATDGLEIVTKRTVDDAIAYLERDPVLFQAPIIILQDINMAVKSGFDLLKWIKEKPRLKSVPVIMLTASKSQGDIDRAYQLGASSYLIKPLRGEDLTSMVEVIERYWGRYNQTPAFNLQSHPGSQGSF